MSGDKASSIHLRRTEENVDDIRAAEKELGERVGIDGVLAHLNRHAERAAVPGQAVEWGFRWNDDDGRSERWWPQGITTSADATEEEDIGGRRLLITSWYSKTLDGENHWAAGSPSSTSTPWRTATCCSSYRTRRGVGSG